LGRISIEMLPLYKNQQYHGVGCGWKTYHDILKNRFENVLLEIVEEPYPLAKNMLPLAKQAFEEQRYVDAEQALPIYLRNQVTFN